MEGTTVDFRKTTRNLGIGIFVLLLFGYGLFQARNLLTGPKISVFEPSSGDSALRQFIEVRGRVKNTSRITINDREVLSDQMGDFMEKMVLSEGYNIIMIKAWDKFGRMESEKVEIVYYK